MPHLALAGGEPTRTAPFAAWPVFGPVEEAALQQVLASGKWFMGTRLEEFEAAFAAFQQGQHGICVSSGTTALQVALGSIPLLPGDEVIIPAYTFIATASAVALTGGVPVFVDVDPDTYNIDPAAVEAAVTERTRAVIAVHIAGRPADLDALVPLAQRHGLCLIEDAAQAHAAAWKGRKVGAQGAMGTFSFQASKNLNAGEGGFVVTDDPQLAQRAWSLHNCGRSPEGAWYEHPQVGGNYRMTEFQAGLLLAQLQRLPEQTAQRTRLAAALDGHLEAIDGITPPVADPRVTTHAYHLYILRYTAEAFGGLSRDRFVEALNAEGIPCSTGYRPLYREAAFQTHFSQRPVESPYYGGVPDFGSLHCPVTERICASEAVWLTQNMLLGNEDDIADIARAIKKIQRHYTELSA